jgi:tRNA dimethylallyltransferase
VARCWPEVELVSIDSMQVYRGMDVGTAKPSTAEQSEVRHHLIDVADPDEDWSVARFQQAFRVVVDDIESRGGRALLVGGTGLYLRAAIDELTLPGEFPEVRADVEAESETSLLYRRLEELDPAAAVRIEPGNRRRVVRALEVTLGSGRPFSSFGPGLEEHPPSRFALAGVWLPREVVAQRIAERVGAMVSGGLVDEVRRLRDRFRLSRTARQALGYKEVLRHLDGELSVEDATDEVVRRTRAFARRQRMWFRRDPRITWHAASANPLAVLPSLLGDWSRRCRR